MKKTTTILTVAIMILIVFTGCTKYAGYDPDNIVPGKVETQYVQCGEYEVIANRLLVGYETTQALNALAEKLNAQILKTVPQIKAASLKIPGDVETTIKTLSSKSIAGIRYIEPSYKREYIKPEVIDNTLSATRDPNDPFYPYLWGAKKINAEAAWDLGYTGDGVIVAVSDAGVDASHPDLQGQFVDGYNAALDQVIPAGTSIPYDSHGTHVSGTIAAVKDNGEGIVGIAPDAKIMPIPIFAPDFIGDLPVVLGWVWAVDNGAKILQNSWGGPGYSHTLKAGIDYAIENGAIVVVSTGNTHINENWGFPNTAPGVIGVGASTVNDLLTEFSSRGDSVSVVAPGESILSTIGMEDGATLQGGLPYSYYNGTSMASPHVSGLAALLYEKYPDATPYEMRKLIEDSAMDMDAPGYDENTGYGRIDALAAVQLASQSRQDAGGNLTIQVADSANIFGIPYVNVTLKRVGKPSYYAQANNAGICSFRGIDPDTYDVYIGGPDYMTFGSRLQEEVAVTLEDFVVGADTDLLVNLESTFSAELIMPDEPGEYLCMIESNKGHEFQEQVAGPGDTVSFTNPDSADNLFYFLSVEASPALVPPASILTEGFESGDFTNADWAWTLGGDVDPFVTNLEASEGTYSAEFGDITDEQTSWMAGTPNVSAGNYWLKFDVQLSTEEDWDFVYVYVDDLLVWTGSGIYDWQTITIPYSGGEITFEYVKDTSFSEVGDTAWIDNIRVIPIPADFDDFTVAGTVTVNGHEIPVSQNLYLGQYVDEFELDTVPWLLL